MFIKLTNIITTGIIGAIITIERGFVQITDIISAVAWRHRAVSAGSLMLSILAHSISTCECVAIVKASLRSFIQITDSVSASDG